MKHNIWKLYVIRASKWFAVYIAVVVPFYQINGLALTQIMLLKSISATVIALVTVPTGYLADRFGKRSLILAGTILTTIAFSIYSVSDNFLGFALAEIMLALGISSIDGADSALLYESVQHDQRHTGRYTRFEGKALAIGNLAEGAASLLGGMIVVLAGLRAPFYAQVIISLIGVPVAYSLRDVEVTDRPTEKLTSFKQTLSYILSNRTLLSFLLASSVMTVAILQTTWLVQPLFQAIQLPVAWFGLVWGALQIIIALGAWQAHRLEHWFSDRKVVAGIFTVMTLSILMMATQHIGLVIIATVLFYAARGVYGHLLREYVNKESLSHLRATILSYRGMLPRMIFIIVAPLIGYVADTTTLGLAFLVLSCGVCISALLTLSLLFKHHAQP